MNQEIPIDLAKLEKITKGDKEFQQMLLTIFMEDAPLFVEDIKKALATEDYELLERRYHQLKGSSASIAMFELSTIAEKLENQGNNKKIEDSGDVVKQMEGMLKQIQLFLDAKDKK